MAGRRRRHHQEIILFAEGGPPENKKEKTLSDFASGGCLISKMQTKTDAQLLREYARTGSEPAFAELVSRRIPLRLTHFSTPLFDRPRILFYVSPD